MVQYFMKFCIVSSKYCFMIELLNVVTNKGSSVCNFIIAQMYKES